MNLIHFPGIDKIIFLFGITPDPAIIFIIAIHFSMKTNIILLIKNYILSGCCEIFIDNIFFQAGADKATRRKSRLDS